MNIGAYRDAVKVREGYWFAQKLFGYGAMPVTWQGWATTVAYIVALMTILRLLPDPAFKLMAGVPLTIAFIWFVYTKTDGGFAWRWGTKKD